MERDVFTYFDGEKQVKRDPLHLYHQLIVAGGGQDFQNLLAKAYPDVKEPSSLHLAEKSVARLEIEKIARVAFRMAPWDDMAGTGASHDDCLNTFERLLRYLNDQKKTAEMKRSGCTSFPDSPQAYRLTGTSTSV